MRTPGVRRRAGRLTVLALALVTGGAACGDTKPDELILSVDGFGDTHLGDSYESVMEASRARWGPAERTSELVCESSAQSKIVNWDGVLMVFNDRGLAGYMFGPKPADAITPLGKDVRRAVTAEGLHVGDAVSSARQAYGKRFVLSETTLGPEWYVAGDYPLLRGFASGLAETDTVDHIGAGDICAVR